MKLKIKIYLWLFNHCRDKLLIEATRRELHVVQMKKSPMFKLYDNATVGKVPLKVYEKQTKRIRKLVGWKRIYK